MDGLIKEMLASNAAEVALPEGAWERQKQMLAEAGVAQRRTWWARLCSGRRLEAAVWFVLLVAALGATALHRVSYELHAGPIRSASEAPGKLVFPVAAEVEVARMQGFPMLREVQPLRAENPADQAIIKRVVDWLGQGELLESLTAEQVNQGLDYDLPRSRSKRLVLHLTGGKTAVVRQAFEGASDREGEVMYYPPDSEVPVRLKAPALAEWLRYGWQVDFGLAGPPEMHFTPVDEPVQVTMAQAQEGALKAVASMLERPPTGLSVELVRYTNDKTGPKDQLVWKITMWGTRTKPIGGKVGVEPPKPDFAALDRSVTWVLVDAQTGAIDSIYSTNR